MTANTPGNTTTLMACSLLSSWDPESRREEGGASSLTSLDEEVETGWQDCPGPERGEVVC